MFICVREGSSPADLVRGIYDLALMGNVQSLDDGNADIMTWNLFRG